MTRSKHLSIVRSALAKGIPQGFSVEQLAEGIVNRIELALELEADESEQGIVEFPLPIPVKPDPPVAWVDPLPAAPPASAPSSSLIVSPDSDEGRALMREPVSAPPIRIGPSADPPDPNSRQLHKYWSLDSLRDFVYKETPGSIQVVATGRTQPISLIRNIEVGYGINIIKLIYRIGGESQPQSSAQNLLGEPLAAITIDIPVSVNFSCYDQQQDVEQKMDAVHKAARELYRKREAHIHSTTPRRIGSSLTFHMPDPTNPDDSNADPHDSVGATANPFDGKVW